MNSVARACNNRGEDSMVTKYYPVLKTFCAGALSLCLGAFSSTLLAHHSAAQFDFSQMVPVTGKVVHVDVANPHIDLILEIASVDGSTREVQFEGHSRNNVYRRGWRPGAFAVGDEITIFIAPMRNGEDGGYIQEFALKDGRKF
jgi:hypothetical protein